MWHTQRYMRGEVRPSLFRREKCFATVLLYSGFQSPSNTALLAVFMINSSSHAATCRLIWTDVIAEAVDIGGCQLVLRVK